MVENYLVAKKKYILLEEWQSSGLSYPEFCRRHGLGVPDLSPANFTNGAKTHTQVQLWVLKTKGNYIPKTELEILRKENDELKKALGEATLDIKILKKKVEMDQQRNRRMSS